MCIRDSYTPEAIKDFLARVGVAKADSTVDGALLEACVRDDLGQRAPRAMAVLHPLKVELTNWPQGQVDDLTMENHPDKPERGQRTVHTVSYTHLTWGRPKKGVPFHYI